MTDLCRLTAPPTLLLAAALLASGCGAALNDGGPLPAGAQSSFGSSELPASAACWFFEDGAQLIHDQADIDDILASCDLEPEQSFSDALESALAEKAEGEALVFVSVLLGGCFGSFDIPVVTLDGDTIRPWLLKEDGSHGLGPDVQVDCPADIGSAIRVLSVAGAADAAEVDLSVGLWNPDLPGNPYDAHGLARE